MKPFAAALALVCTAAATAAQQPQTPSATEASLRQALQEFRAESSEVPRRQLSEQERAELRRQLHELARPPARRAGPQDPR